MPPRKITRALNDYNRAIALVDDDPNMFNDRGNSYAAFGDLDRALADFDKAVALKPDYALPIAPGCSPSATGMRKRSPPMMKRSGSPPAIQTISAIVACRCSSSTRR